jgi:Tfp pilus assembly PilM family ATPase
MIGIDINDKLIKLVEIKQGPAGPILNHYAVVELAQKPLTLAAALKENGFEERAAFINISGPKVQVRRITLPPMPESEMYEAVKWAAKDFLTFPIAQAVINYYRLDAADNKGGKNEVIVVAAEAAALKERLAIVESAGLKCAGVTIPAFALLELARSLPQLPRDQFVAWLDLGAVSTHLAILHNGALLFAREINAQEKLLPEVASSFAYFREHHETEGLARLYLSGDLSNHGDLATELSAYLGISAEVVDPTITLHPAPALDAAKIKEAAPQLAQACGLALSRESEVNLLKINRKEQEKRQIVQLFNRALDRVQIPNAAIFGALALAVALIVGLNYYLNFSIQKTKSDLDVKTLKLSQLVKYRDRTLAFQDISRNRIDIGQLLTQLNGLLPEGMSLTYLNYDYEKRTVELGGESVKPQLVSGFVRRIEGTPHFRDTRLFNIQKLGEETATFRLGFRIEEK